MKARFEEAKLYDLGQSASNSMAQKPVEQSSQRWPKDSLVHHLEP